MRPFGVLKHWLLTGCLLQAGAPHHQEFALLVSILILNCSREAFQRLNLGVQAKADHLRSEKRLTQQEPSADELKHSLFRFSATFIAQSGWQPLTLTAGTLTASLKASRSKSRCDLAAECYAPSKLSRPLHIIIGTKCNSLVQRLTRRNG
eukprot:scaffold601738_cov43-Prasinocladus_malaysianus.AAC.1